MSITTLVLLFSFFAHPKELLAKVLPAQEQGFATWYAYKGCNCAASTLYPKGSYLVVSRTDDPTKSVTVRVNDYGPNSKKHPERIIDLDKMAFKKIASLSTGTVPVRVQLLQ
ncbi:MAG: septal ring lytic transglycosylase RlpA family protein [Candidatus Uhrbacteria bacterium]|nr:septal ring lytic transglycosylase RlpA family protein [Candidatus Uhrbacteria bacterium]